MTRFDLKLTENKEIDLTNLKPGFVTGSDYIKQKINIELDFYFQEWFLDTRQGTQWRELVFIKGFNLAIIERHIRDRLLSIEEIREILTYNQELKKENNKNILVINFKVSTVDSDQVTILKEVVL